MTIALLITLTVTAYSPKCGGISGSTSHFYADGSSRPHPSHHLRYAACGRQFSFGQRLRIYGLEQFGVTVVECHDRGAWVSGIDVLSFSGEGCAQDYALAREIGKRRLSVEVIDVPRDGWVRSYPQ